MAATRVRLEILLVFSVGVRGGTRRVNKKKKKNALRLRAVQRWQKNTD